MQISQIQRFEACHDRELFRMQLTPQIFSRYDETKISQSPENEEAEDYEPALKFSERSAPFENRLPVIISRLI